MELEHILNTECGFIYEEFLYSIEIQNSVDRVPTTFNYQVRRRLDPILNKMQDSHKNPIKKAQSKKKKCLECSNFIQSRSTRCIQCFTKLRKRLAIENSYKKCPKCNVNLIKKKSRTCIRCFHLSNSKRPKALSDSMLLNVFDELEQNYSRTAKEITKKYDISISDKTIKKWVQKAS